jgi:predicted transposase YdaD
MSEKGGGCICVVAKLLGEERGEEEGSARGTRVQEAQLEGSGPIESVRLEEDYGQIFSNIRTTIYELAKEVNSDLFSLSCYYIDNL